LDQYGATSLLPVTASEDSQATVNVFETIPRGAVFVSLSVTTVGDDRPLLSINTYPSDSDYVVDCDRRIAPEDPGGEGSPTWNAVQIRENQGCSATNELGLTFIEWIEGDLSLHVETHLPHDDAVAWLTSWELNR
jgi:hypothetical protein